MLKAIIFDFDGVIAESVEVKTDAFRRLFEQYPEHLNDIIEYHTINGGISRYVKFEHIFSRILKRPLSEVESKRLGGLFTQYALEGVIESPLVVGAPEFLEKYHQKLMFFIVSGTPEDEMLLIAEKRRLGRFFKSIYGSPRSKTDLIRMILKDHQLRNEELIFVGDSINDYDGAAAAGVLFIARRHPGEENPFAGLNIKNTINNMNELQDLLIKEKLL